MIFVFTGDGKGKTTASLGQMLRSLGRNKRALMIQFIKGPWISGEDEFAAKFQIPDSKFQIKKMGLGFVGILGDQLPKEKHAEAAQNALEYFKKEWPNWDIIVLDEINVAVSLSLLGVKEVVEAIKGFPAEKLLILSGRGAPKEFIEVADLATEMKELKHPYQSGEKARYGIEF